MNSVLQLDLPLSGPSSPKEENKDAQYVNRDHNIQLHEEHEDLERQQACLHTWTDLQDDIYQLHQLFTDFNKIVHVSIFHLFKVMFNNELFKSIPILLIQGSKRVCE